MEYSIDARDVTPGRRADDDCWESSTCKICLSDASEGLEIPDVTDAKYGKMMKSTRWAVCCRTSGVYINESWPSELPGAGADMAAQGWARRPYETWSGADRQATKKEQQYSVQSTMTPSIQSKKSGAAGGLELMLCCPPHSGAATTQHHASMVPSPICGSVRFSPFMADAKDQGGPGAVPKRFALCALREGRGVAP